MKIQNMFVDDINREINGVIQVGQKQEEVLVQEMDEYIITKELKKHFITFFNYYSDAFREPTQNTGVWISGFFGSGKSHFLKILSYILDNETVDGVPTVERFRKKFDDDPGTYMLIDQSTRGETETILFNIDVEGFSSKDNTAVLRVFAKMFYNHLGFYGEDLKVAKLEQFIDSQGKTKEFHRVFEEINGAAWVDTRDSSSFFEDDLVETLMQVLGMSETSARNWFNGTDETELSIAKLVSEIKAYVDTKPDNFRLIFLADEVGQYIGEHTDMLLNLQSLIEALGSECGGKVWMICTGQEAMDDIIRTRQNEFSRIQARFKTRLSLSSSSVDEVIQKRILNKKPEAKNVLEEVYKQNDSVLRNLFSFTDSVLDIKGYGGTEEFTMDFPFVPYQFIIMQKVFSEVRKHGNAGKHFSGAERSMLSGFQEAVQRIENKDEYALVPLFRFYDTVHGFLDGSIRRVIERCDRAVEDGNGIEAYDVDVLKLLYLVRYVDDVKASLDNIVILMADDIRVDKISLKEKVKASLGRLESQNYIGRTGDTYNFLTDEEQDIAREIKNTTVDTASIVDRICKTIFGDLYSTKKYRNGKYDFSFDKMVDSVAVGNVTGGMKLKFMTAAADESEKSDLRLIAESKGSAIVVLADTPYYENLESSMKIRKYVLQRNVPQLPRSVQDIIHQQQEEAGRYEEAARKNLEDAIAGASFYVDGEHLQIRAGSAVSKIEQAMEYLVSHVYSNLDLITKNAESDTDISTILTATRMAGTEENRNAAARMEEFLEIQSAKRLPTSMADIQKKYQGIPYGWKEIDIAAVAALLIAQQKVTIKYGGMTIQPDNSKLPDMLRKKSEIGKTMISKRQIISFSNMKAVRELLREYFDRMDVPEDEDNLVQFIVTEFGKQKAHYEARLRQYSGHRYPDQQVVEDAISVLKDVLSQAKDNVALIQRVLDDEDKLFDSKDDTQSVESFFDSQVTVFDKALNMKDALHNDRTYLKNAPEAEEALNLIRLITSGQLDGRTVYKRIPELNGLMETVRTGHDTLLQDKRDELFEITRQCMESVHMKAEDSIKCQTIITNSDDFYSKKKQEIANLRSLALLDALAPQMWTRQDQDLKRIEIALTPPKSEDDDDNTPPRIKPRPQKKYKTVYRNSAFPSKTLESQSDIDAYVESIRKTLMQQLKDVDGIEIS